MACSLEGTRPVLLEVQALITPTLFGMPRRTAAGTDYNRVNVLMAVLEKRCHYELSRYDAYVNIAGGRRMNEPALDLAIVMAVISSLKDRPVNPRTIIFGEVGLAGEVRAVPMAEQRVNEAKKLGFETCILPKTSLDKMRKMEGILSGRGGEYPRGDFTAVRPLPAVKPVIAGKTAIAWESAIAWDPP